MKKIIPNPTNLTKIITLYDDNHIKTTGNNVTLLTKINLNTKWKHSYQYH